MSWNTPSHRTTGTLITASIWNTDVIDNLIALRSISSVIELSGAGFWPSTTSGCVGAAQTELGTNKVNYKCVSFVKSVTTYAEVEIPAMPSDWDSGSLTAVFAWNGGADTSTNSVIWGIQGRCYGDGDALDQAMGTAQEVTDNNASTANQERISAATAAITLAGTPAPGKKAHIRIYRKGASDTMANTAYLDGGVVLTYSRA